MTLDEFLDYHIGQGMAIEAAIEEASKVKYFKIYYTKEKYEQIIQKRQRPLLDWLDKT